MMHAALNIACLMLALYVVMVSLGPLANMDKGLQCFCHKMKYLAALGGACWVLWLALFMRAHAPHLVIVIISALFCWPRTVYWLRETLDDFDYLINERWH